MKLTPWFPPEIKPAYPGVYEVLWPPGAWYRLWDGKRWCAGDCYKDMAALQNSRPARPLPWRGLAKPPKGWKR